MGREIVGVIGVKGRLDMSCEGKNLATHKDEELGMWRDLPIEGKSNA